MENISERKSAATSFPFLSLIPEIMGINAEFMAPSANNLLKRLGSLKATKKESET